MEPLDVTGLRDAMRREAILWSKHVLQRLAEQGIRQQHVIDVVLRGECIETYRDDRPFPSGLFLGWIGERPYHVVVAYDPKAHYTYVITAYEPSLDYFESDFKTRR